MRKIVARIIAGFVWATLLLLVASAPVGQAAFPGANGKLAFHGNQDGDQEIFAMNPNGTGVTQLTTNNANDIWPAWSPDGAKIVFQSDRDGDLEIYVMNADGSGQTNLTNNSANEGYPTWSPDGSKIAFVSNRDGNHEIYVMNADGTGQTNRSANVAGEGSPAWSPDGAKIAFSRDVGASAGRLDIYVMNADGSAQAPLITGPSHDDNPNWSPDGSKITFTSDRVSLFNNDIYVANADGSTQTRLTFTMSNHYSAWSPDGAKIAFGSWRDGNGEIYTMNPDGSNQTRITTTTPAWAWSDKPDWQPITFEPQGFFSPVDMGGVLNTVKGGSTIPLKFRILKDDGDYENDLAAISSFKVYTIACDQTGPTDPIEVTTTGGTSLRYDGSTNQYVQNWQTPKKPGECRRVVVTLANGSTLTADFHLK